MLDHPVGDELREEVGALEIDVQDPIETLFGGFEKIQTFGGTGAGVVDEQIASSEFRPGRFDDLLSRAKLGDAACDELALHAGRGGFVQDLGPFVLDPVDDQVVTQGRQLQCDAPADAPAGAGDDGDGPICHDGTSFRKKHGTYAYGCPLGLVVQSPCLKIGRRLLYLRTTHPGWPPSA